jgi:uncharacterized protein (TIGR02302 family)
MADERAGEGQAGLNDRARAVAERLTTLARRAGLVIAWERAWPWMALALTVIALFLALSWLGLWLHLPLWARPVGVGLAALALIACAAGLLRARVPPWRDALARIDRDSNLPHRPATALTDELAINTADPGTRALWEAHRARVLNEAARLKVAPPRPDLPRRDPWAIRFGVALAAVTAFFIAGPEREARLLAAFDWASPASAEGGFRLDGWIDPPAYTQVPPLLLDLKPRTGLAEASPKVKVPVRSTLVIRASDAAGLTLTPAGGLVVPEEPKNEQRPGDASLVKVAAQQAPKTQGIEARWTVKGDGTLTVRRGTSTVATIAVTSVPDLPPSIEILNEPRAGENGSLSLAYGVKDDYGVVAAEARFGRQLRQGKPVESRRPPLVPAPSVALALPGGDNRDGETTTSADLTAHPWAGARVEMTLAARDEIGQEGQSVTIGVTIPQRSFTKPLARALVEQRRNLILDPAGRANNLRALYALMIAPDRFTPDASTYLGLRIASTRLQGARTDADLLAVADLLWEIALQIEDGDLSDAEKALKQAQDALRDALDRGATDQEIRRLTQELRNALDRFLREYAEKQLRNQDPNQQMSRMDRNMRMLTPQDLKSMLDRMEEMARRGDTADAQRMLKQLKDILDNLRTARPGQQRQMQQGQREMEQALDDLDRMARDQQELRDKTFREGQRRRDQMRQGNRQQQGQNGQRGQRGQRGQQGQQGQQGQNGEGQDDMAQGGDGDQEGMDGLGQRQQALRDQLRELKRRMRENGMNGEQGLEDAEEAMRQAEGALGQGNDGQAVEAQGRALEGLRRGAQGLAQQMQQGDGTDTADGQPGQPGQPGNRAQASEPNDDPLGRPTPTTEAGDRSKFRRAGKGGTLEQRAREVMEELRRRLGEQTRPQEELDYLQRLLPLN